MSKKNITIGILLAILMIVIGIGIGISITKIDSNSIVVGALNKKELTKASDVMLQNASLDNSDVVSRNALNAKLDLLASKSGDLDFGDNLLAKDGVNDLYNVPVVDVKGADL